MEFLIEIIFEMIISGLIVVCEECKVPKWIRYIAGSIAFLFYVMIFVILIIVGIKALEVSIILGIILLFIVMMFMALFTIKARNTYLKISKNTNKEKASEKIKDIIIGIVIIISSFSISDKIMLYIKNDSFIIKLILIIILSLAFSFIIDKLINLSQVRQIMKNNEFD